MKKVRVALYGNLNRVAILDADATEGATIGKDLRLPNGQIADMKGLAAALAAFITTDGGGGSSNNATLWRLIGEIPPNVVAIEHLNTAGLIVRKSDSTMVTRSIATADGTRIAVTDGDGIAGNPTLDLALVPDSGLGQLRAITRDGYGRVTGSRLAVLNDLDDVLAAPGDGEVLMYDAASTSWKSAPVPHGGVTVGGRWRFEANTTAVKPGPNHFALNNVSLPAVTEIYITEQTADLNDAATLLSLLDEGDRFFFQDEDDSTKAGLYTINGPGVDNGDWWTFAVTFENGGAVPVDGAMCGVGVQFGDPPQTLPGPNTVTNAMLAQMPALTVKGNATNATANAQDIPAAANDTFLRRVGNALSFGGFTAAMFAGFTIPATALPAIPVANLPANVMLEGENVSLLTNDAGYIGAAGLADYARLSTDNTFSHAGQNNQRIQTTDATSALVSFATAGVARGLLGAIGLNDSLFTGGLVGDVGLRAQAGRVLLSGDGGNIQFSVAPGKVRSGAYSDPTYFGGNPGFAHAGSGNASFGSFARYQSGTPFGASIAIMHSRHDTIGAHAILQNGDDCGDLAFFGSDGTGWLAAARIFGQIDGAPAANVMPGRLVFAVNAGGISPAERMRLTATDLTTSVNTATIANVGGFPKWVATNIGNSSVMMAADVAQAYVGTTTNHPLVFIANNAPVGNVTPSGAWTLNNTTQILTPNDAQTLALVAPGGRLRMFASSGGFSYIQARNNADSALGPLAIQGNPLNIDGSTISLNGVNVTDFARLSAGQSFTGTNYFMPTTYFGAQGSVGYLTLQSSGLLNTPGFIGFYTGDNTRRAYLGYSSGTQLLITAETGWSWQLNGVSLINGLDVADFARKSQINTFTNQQRIVNSGLDDLFWLAGAASPYMSFYNGALTQRLGYFQHTGAHFYLSNEVSGGVIYLNAAGVIATGNYVQVSNAASARLMLASGSPTKTFYIANDGGVMYFEATDYINVNVAGATRAQFLPAQFLSAYQIRNSGGGITVSGGVSAPGVAGAHAFIDLNGGAARFGCYDWNTSTWQPTQLGGSTIDIASQTGSTITINTSGIVNVITPVLTALGSNSTAILSVSSGGAGTAGDAVMRWNLSGVQAWTSGILRAGGNSLLFVPAAQLNGASYVLAVSPSATMALQANQAIIDVRSLGDNTAYVRFWVNNSHKGGINGASSAGWFGAGVGDIVIYAVTGNIVFTVNNGGYAQFKVAANGSVVFGAIGGDPASPADGAMWYNSSIGKIRAMVGGLIQNLN